MSDKTQTPERKRTAEEWRKKLNERAAELERRLKQAEEKSSQHFFDRLLGRIAT